MYQNQKVCVVIPAYNEALQITSVIDSMPEFIDRIIVVDDKSSDDTATTVKKMMKNNSKIDLILHDENQGCGGALATGYQQAIEEGFDIAVRMDGDGQMLPEYLPALLKPISENRADYTKGNRLFTGEAFKRIPKIRYFGNAL